MRATLPAVHLRYAQERADLWIQCERGLGRTVESGQMGWHADSAVQRALAPGAQAGAAQPGAVPAQHALGARQSLPRLPAHPRIPRLLQPPGTPAQSHRPASTLFCFTLFPKRQYDEMILLQQETLGLAQLFRGLSSFTASWDIGRTKPHACRHFSSCLWDLCQPMSEICPWHQG